MDLRFEDLDLQSASMMPMTSLLSLKRHLVISRFLNSTPADLIPLNFHHNEFLDLLDEEEAVVWRTC